MRILLVIPFLISFQFLSAQSVKKLHKRAILVDTHNDVLSSSVLEGKDISHRLATGQSDLDRWKEGGVDVQFFSVWTDRIPRNKEGFFKDANQEIDSLEIITLRNPFRMTLATTYRQVKKGIHQNKFVALIGVEGGHMIENDMAKLDSLFRRGMRYLTLTWNNSTPWATSAMDETLNADSLKHKGLTEFGKQVVHRLNELGVLVDLSHVGEQTFYDAIATTSKPVLLSHSSVWNICPVFRNVKDDQIKAVAKNGGVICVNFYSGFISKKFDERSTWLNGEGKKRAMDSLMAIYHDSTISKTKFDEYQTKELNKVRPSISQVVDHIDYIVKLVGDDYAGIGSDFDGVSSLPVGLDDVTKYPLITEELKKRGYSNKSIKKILGGNVLRVMKANMK
ncbi:MAG TPA: dipeptidase [Chitinophagaceae bacterium]|nr:dipeptidase [Chitinophagaceae bacterium]